MGRPPHRILGRPFSASIVVALVALVACRNDAPSGGHRSLSDASRAAGVATSEHLDEAEFDKLERRVREMLTPGVVLPSGTQTAALAEELAVAAARSGSGPRALSLLRSAAELRTRMWRVGHREADARDAMELHGIVVRDALAQGLLDEGCSSALGRAVVESELAHDPERLYRDLYVASRIFAQTRCSGTWDHGLVALAAHRPARTILGMLDEQAAKERTLALARRTESVPSAPVVSADEGDIVLAPPAPSRGARVKVLAIDPYGGKDRARIVVMLSGPTSYRVGNLPGPRLFLDLERTEPSSRREVAVGGLVERVRQSRRPDAAAADEVTRISLDLTTQPHRRIFYLPEPFRVVIDLATREPPRASAPPGSARQVARVAIDAGHGGADPGAIGPAGLREKDVTLDIAHLAAPMLASELGILTLLTRDDDRLVPLDERTARANAFHADLFVSIHCNASENNAAHGVMSFVLDTARDEIASAVAARENATSIAATSQAASIASGLRLADLGERSTHFAELLQHAAVGSLASHFSDVSDQGVKRAGFFVLVGAEMPSVLFETAFISNPWEERRLTTPDYRQRLAAALTQAVRAYREGL
jgi:N-acetylmuramoyl-L-alanine amidase